ncbi:metallophosphoesterase [Clostridium neuense]|uniref:Phosphoesterase n=1 Tax=Clostridium neuense TaxID=1728934 RepID=A0ABW8TLG8_9CLOT
MHIAVMSDTHRNKHMIDKACSHIENADVVIHLGDNVEDINEIRNKYSGEIISVTGNCDFMTTDPLERIEIIGGKKFFITHGHEYGVKYNLNRLKYRAMEVKADIALFGHTHMPFIANELGILFINPGSVSLSRKGPNSIAFIGINNGKISASIKNI